MRIITESISLSTRGNTDMVDITPQAQEIVHQHGLKEGQITLFVSGSTAGLTTVEFEPGLIKDLPEAFEKIAPAGRRYHHDDTWGDGNGHAHVRASLLGPSLVVPFSEGKLLLGTWQQIVLMDFDTHGRRRSIVVQLIGE